MFLPWQLNISKTGQPQHYNRPAYIVSFSCCWTNSDLSGDGQGNSKGALWYLSRVYWLQVFFECSRVMLQFIRWKLLGFGSVEFGSQGIAWDMLASSVSHSWMIFVVSGCDSITILDCFDSTSIAIGVIYDWIALIIYFLFHNKLLITLVLHVLT